MQQYRFGWVMVATLSAALFLGPTALAQQPCHADVSIRDQDSHELLRLALRGGVSKLLQIELREALRSHSDGEFRPLLALETRLETEEGRLQANGGPQPRRARRVREALGRICGRDLEIPRRLKGLTGGIQGKVTDASSGIPLDFEFVEVYDALGDFVDLDLTDDGDYTIDGLDPGTYFLRVDASDHLDELYDDIPCPLGVCNVTNGTPVQVTQGASTTGIDFALTSGGRILGSVSEADSGLPLGFEFVDVFNALGDLVDLALTDSAGNYLVGGLPTGTYYARADPSDYLDQLYEGISCPLEACTPTDGTPIAVTLGSDTSGVDFVLEPGGRISGNLSEQITGLPLGFQFVELFNALGNRVSLSFTDSAGNYSIGGLPSGNYFAVTETLSDYFDELYDDLPCPNESCEPTSGTPISVSVDGITPGIDFVLSANGPAETPRLSESAGLVVPILVDLTDPNGRTTFFAVHNTTDSTLAVELGYYAASIADGPVRTDSLTLAPEATTTVNVRSDLTGYDTSGLDLLTGLVLITEQGVTTAPNLIGDSFSLDPANDFASGDRLVRASDLCNRQRIRFVDFGSGTELKVLLNEPRGAGTPSFSYTAFNESGTIVGSGNFFAEEHFMLVDRAVFASQSFGVLEVDFGNALGGQISAVFSAFGRFSVDLGGECLK